MRNASQVPFLEHGTHGKKRGDAVESRRVNLGLGQSCDGKDEDRDETLGLCKSGYE